MIKGAFVLVSVFYLTLQSVWEVNLYIPQTQKNLKMFFTYKQLVKLRKLIIRAKTILRDQK